MSRLEVELMAVVFVLGGVVLGATLWELYRPAPEVRHVVICKRTA